MLGELNAPPFFVCRFYKASYILCYLPAKFTAILKKFINNSV